MELFYTKKLRNKKATTFKDCCKTALKVVLFMASQLALSQFNTTIPLQSPPEDCPLALRLCNASQQYSFQLTDDGLIDDAHGSLIIPGLSNTSPNQFESKVAWLKFTPQYSGQFGFLIFAETPEEYQFQMFTNPNCSNIETGVYTTPDTTYSPCSSCGMNGVGTGTIPNALPWITITAGNTYVLFVQTRYYLQPGTHRFTLKFQGQVVTDHPDLFDHPDCILSSGVEELVLEDYVTVSPNPFATGFSIHSPLSFSTLKVYDLMGKLIHEQDYATEIELKDLSAGIYMLHLIDANGKVTVRKVVKE